MVFGVAMNQITRNSFSLVVISSLLLCAFAGADGEENCAAGKSLAGRYLSTFWGIGVDVLGPPTIVTIFEMNHTGCNTYEGAWIGTGVYFSGLYSPENRQLSGTWFRLAAGRWGTMQYYWNGVSISGQSTEYGEIGLGYETFVPVNSTFQVPEPVTCP